MKEAPWVEVLGHAEKLLQLVGDTASKGVFPLTPSANSHIVSMFWRARRLYDGVLILLKAELPEEAAILARSLFEVSLHLRQLEAEPDNRYALIFGWVNHSIDEQFWLLKACEPNKGLDKAFARSEERRKENRKEASELGVTKFQTFLTTKDAVLKFDRNDDYLIHQWTNESVHGSEAVWMFARLRPAEDTVGLYAKTGDPLVRSIFAHFSARSMADAAKALFAILGWTLSPEVEQTVGDIKRLLESNVG